MINDLRPPAVATWKYIDDTTISKVLPRNGRSSLQDVVDNVQNWSDVNRLQLNVSKCKELLIYFGKTTDPFSRVSINSGQLDLVDHARMLGLTVSNDLKWNEHVSIIIKKANKRRYFIVQLKRAKVALADIVTFYCICVRPVLEYSCQVYHYALPVYLSDAIERVQRSE